MLYTVNLADITLKTLPQEKTVYNLHNKNEFFKIFGPYKDLLNSKKSFINRVLQWK